MNTSESTLRKRFFDKFIPEPNSGCWIWDATCNKAGYGIIAKGRSANKPLLAHRVSMILHGIEIPDGMLVLHSCDTPACVNPDHLRVGNHKDNARDMVKRGRNINTIKAAKEKTGPSNPRYGYRAEACKLGHKFTPENTRTYQGKQICRACHREWQLSYKQRRQSHAHI